MPLHSVNSRKRPRGTTSRAGRFLKLIDSWRAEDPGYDERVWPIVKKAIEENRLSARRRFRD
jgi:hypothetical protein